jgi:DNA polymerase III delta prime subunit
MKVKIPEKLWRAAGGADTFKFYGCNSRDFSWQKYTMLDLGVLTPKRLDHLANMLESHRKIRGTGVILRDIKTWKKATAGDDALKPRSVEQFSSLLKVFLSKVPGHRIYQKDGDVWVGYYVNSVQFTPAREDRNGYRNPPRVDVKLIYVEMEERHSETITFYAEGCLHKTANEALVLKGWYVETPELRAAYLESMERFHEVNGRVGLQVWGRGLATDNLDGNGDRDRWRHNVIRLDHTGAPARMVVDVYQESDSSSSGRGNRPSVDVFFWKRKRMFMGLDSGDDGEDDTMDDLDDDLDEEAAMEEFVEDEVLADPPEIEIPTHPIIPCFDMKRHLRLRVHIDGLEIYEYDRKLAEKLVLPKDLVSMIEILIAGGGAFRDIVDGKSGGSIILCAGPAGVGKTLTAEVYSEAVARPLYSIQCSQLGIDADDLEKELMKAFARADRWNAIVLLDEADVYVMTRGRDLVQNAIVGVFLRVLEYFPGTMFMTTNRSDMVDDAIASRCIARIDYGLPSQNDQAKLWRILADTAGVPLEDTVIAEILETHSDLSGRDIKNLIKLAHSVAVARGEPISPEIVSFVKRFKPTKTITATPKTRRAKPK